MLNNLLLIFSISAYGIATYLLAQQIRTGDQQAAHAQSLQTSATIGIALISHIVYAYQYSMQGEALNFGLSPMVILVSAILVLIYFLGSLAIPIGRLGILVFPLTIICLVFAQLWPNQDQLSSQLGGALAVHILVSIVSYCLLTIAAIQAVLYAYQERQLKRHAKNGVLKALPPMQTMELLLFRLVWLGFGLLTLTLVSGALFSHEIFGAAFTFNHKTVLTILAWLVFAILLFKRLKQNLRGTQAVAWTIAGFALIQLGYFGTKVVSESLAVQ